jgi:hypothetical protein
MYLVYQPEGQDEPTKFKYNPRKLMSAEREMVEKKSGKNFSQFTSDVLAGNARDRRVLLFMYLKRTNPQLRFEDVDFAWDELTLQHSKGELQEMKDKISEAYADDKDLPNMLAELDRQIESAYEDDDEGKAKLPIAD